MRILGCAHRSPRPPLPPPPDPRTVEDLSANLKPYQQKHWRHVPRFLTPLKPHTVTRAFLGNLRPTVTLYKGHVNITANSKFWYNSTSSVCTIVIPTCTLKDSGEYCVLVENKLGKDCSSSKLTVYGEGAKPASGRPGGGGHPRLSPTWGGGAKWQSCGRSIHYFPMADTIFYLICHGVVYIFSN